MWCLSICLLVWLFGLALCADCLLVFAGGLICLVCGWWFAVGGWIGGLGCGDLHGAFAS